MVYIVGPIHGRSILTNQSPIHKSTRVGFYGLDVYSLLDSLEAILVYLREVDGKEAIRTAVHQQTSIDSTFGGLRISFIQPPTSHQTDLPGACPPLL